MKLIIKDDLAEYTQKDLEVDMALLPPWRREQALRYKFFNGQRDCTLSYLSLCQALKEEYGIEEKPTFVLGEHGKPSLLEFPHVHFNISHCAKAVACIVSDRPVGIDVESTDRKVSPALIKHTMNEEEQRKIDADITQFFRYWTQKEALVKLKGTGLQDHLHKLLSPKNTEGIELITEDHSHKGYVLTIAFQKK